MFAAAILATLALAGAAAADEPWTFALGGDTVQAGGPGNLGGLEWCWTAGDCQAAMASGLGGMFGSSGPAGIANVQGGPIAWWVADPSNNRIERFDAGPSSFGAALGKDAVQAGRSGDTGTGFEVCTISDDCQAATAGGLGGEMNGPVAVATDGSRVYVADPGNHRIDVFTQAGAFVAAWGKDVIRSGRPGDTGTGYEVCAVATDCQTGTAGAAAGGELSNPTGVAADASGHLFVADAGGLRVQRFSSAGVFQRAWGRNVVQSGHTGDSVSGRAEICTAAADCQAGVAGGQGGELATGTLGIAASGGSVFVSEGGGNRVQVFDADGAFQRAWGKGVDGGGVYGVCTAAAACASGSAGGLGGEMSTPGAVTANAGAVFVAEAGGHRVQRFDDAGTWTRAWGRGVRSDTPTTFGICTVAASCLSGTAGALGGELNQPLGIAGQDVNAGTVMVANAGDRRLDQFGLPTNGTATCCSTTVTTSTTSHPYTLYLGSLSLARPGGAPYRTVTALASQIRVTQSAADGIAKALGDSTRVGDGFAAHAPDGGSWITSVPDPTWWEHPNGGSAPADEPTFDARGAFAARLAPEAQLAPGENVGSCTDTTETVTRLDITASPWPANVTTTTLVGPQVSTTGAEHRTRYFIVAGGINIDTNVSYPVFLAHRSDRTCEVTAAGGAPPGAAAPAVTPGTTPSKNAVKAADVIFLPAAKACVSRRRFRIRLKVPKTVAVTSAEVTVGKRKVKVVKGGRLASKIDLSGLPKGRFMVTIVLRLADGSTLKSTRRYRACAPRRRSPR